jgi:hypothetical protein
MADFAAIRFQPSRPLLRELSADRLNSILAEIRRNKPLPGRGITVRQTGQGTAIDLAASIPRGGGTSTPATPQPWDLIARVDPDADPEDENPPYLVTVRPGTLNGFLPSNYDTEGANGSVDVPCLGTGLYYAKAVITTDGQAITDVAVKIDTTAPIEQQPQPYALEETIEYLFGLFSEGQVYRVIGPGQITLRPEQWLVTAVDPPAAPGEAPYTIYYRLM